MNLNSHLIEEEGNLNGLFRNFNEFKKVQYLHFVISYLILFKKEQKIQIKCFLLQ
jgi:hypothetical protein